MASVSTITVSENNAAPVITVVAVDDDAWLTASDNLWLTSSGNPWLIANA